MKESVDSEALVMPSSTSECVAGRLIHRRAAVVGASSSALDLLSFRM